MKESRWADFLLAFFKATLRRVRRADRAFELRGEAENLAFGFVRENFQPVDEVLTSDLQKSGSSTGVVDHEVWSYVKNYPRRNYLSPADCPRKILDSGCQKPRTEKFPTPTSPPVSYLGWNISGIVREVITKQPKPGKTGKRALPNPRHIVLIHDPAARRARAKHQT